MFVSVGKGVYIPTERIHSIVPASLIQFSKIKKIYQGIDVITQSEDEEEGVYKRLNKFNRCHIWKRRKNCYLYG